MNTDLKISGRQTKKIFIDVVLDANEHGSLSKHKKGKGKVKVKSLSRVRLFATPWTIACHAPLSVGFSKQEYWSGVPLPSPVTYMRKK